MKDYSKHIEIKDKILQMCIDNDIATCGDIYNIAMMLFPNPVCLDTEGTYYFNNKIYKSQAELPTEALRMQSS